MTSWIRAVAMAALLAPAVPAAAQPAPSQPRVLIDVGGTILGGGTLGSTEATYTTPTGQSMTLFSTSQSWSAGPGIIGHLQVRVKPRVALELTGSWTLPEIRSKITGDFEAAADTTAVSTVSQFLTSGALVVSFTPRGKWTPFARGAVSWVRHLSNDQTLYQDGMSAELGGGVRYTWKEKRGHLKPYGVRADVWISARTGGLELAQKSRVIAPGFSAAFIFKL